MPQLNLPSALKTKGKPLLYFCPIPATDIFRRPYLQNKMPRALCFRCRSKLVKSLFWHYAKTGFFDGLKYLICSLRDCEPRLNTSIMHTVPENARQGILPMGRKKSSFVNYVKTMIFLHKKITLSKKNPCLKQKKYCISHLLVL